MENDDSKNKFRGVVLVNELFPGHSREGYLAALNKLDLKKREEISFRGRVLFDETDNPLILKDISKILGCTDRETVQMIRKWIMGLAENLGEKGFEINSLKLKKIAEASEKKYKELKNSFVFKTKRVNITFLGDEAIDKYINLARDLGTPTEFTIIASSMNKLDENALQVDVFDDKTVEETHNKIMRKAVNTMHKVLFDN